MKKYIANKIKELGKYYVEKEGGTFTKKMARNMKKKYLSMDGHARLKAFG